MHKFLSFALTLTLHGCIMNVSRPDAIDGPADEHVAQPPIASIPGFTVEAMEVPDTFEIEDHADIVYGGKTVFGEDRSHDIVAGTLRFKAEKRIVIERVKYVVRTGDSWIRLEERSSSGDAAWLTFPGYEVHSLTTDVTAWTPYQWSCVGSCSEAFVNARCIDSGEGCAIETSSDDVAYQDCSSPTGGCHSTLNVPSGLIDETDQEDFGLLTFELRIAHVDCGDTIETIVYAIETSEGTLHANIAFTRTRRG